MRGESLGYHRYIMNSKYSEITNTVLCRNLVLPVQYMYSACTVMYYTVIENYILSVLHDNYDITLQKSITCQHYNDSQNKTQVLTQI